MKKHLLLLAMILLPLVASAHDIEVQNADGVTIYYNYIYDGKELAVTYPRDSYYSYFNKYQGNVAIPEEVTYMNRTRKVTSIGDLAFKDCSGLTSVTIPNSVTRIGYNAFYDCSGLTSVTIPNSVTSIDKEAFYGCSGLTSVTIGNSVTSIDKEAFFGCSGLTSVTIGNSVTTIGDYAFYKCSGLTSVTIPNSVTSIGNNAFSYCSGLTSVTIGNSVTSIGNNAFSYCSGLTSIVCLAINPPSCKYSDGVPYESCILSVPEGCINTYKDASWWRNFSNIVEGVPSGINAVKNTKNNNTIIYDLNGVRQSEPKKGINIINGKKVVIK